MLPDMDVQYSLQPDKDNLSFGSCHRSCYIFDHFLMGNSCMSLTHLCHMFKLSMTHCAMLQLCIEGFTPCWMSPVHQRGRQALYLQRAGDVELEEGVVDLPARAAGLAHNGGLDQRLCNSASLVALHGRRNQHDRKPAEPIALTSVCPDSMISIDMRHADRVCSICCFIDDQNQSAEHLVVSWGTLDEASTQARMFHSDVPDA